MKFNELIDRLRGHNIKIEEQYGEFLDEDMTENQELEMTAENWAGWMARKRTEDKAEAEKCKALADKYSERAKRFEKSAEWRSQGLLELVKMVGKTIKVAEGTIFMGKSKESVEIIGDVPDEFKKSVTTTSPDKASIEIYLRSLEPEKRPNWAVIKDGKEFVTVRV